jgi:hypothetical protein
MKKIMVLLLTVVLTLLGSVVMEGPVTESATDVTSQTNSITTAVGETTATQTLSSEHWYSDETELTVVCATDGDVTSGITLGADRKAITLTGLTADTTQDCEATYLDEIDDATMAITLKIIPFLVIMIGIMAALGGVGLGVMSVAGRANIGATVIQGVMTIFIGVILVPVVLNFQNNASTTYSIAPEYIGVSSVVSLCGIAYILALLGSAVGAFAPQIRSFGGSWRG